MKLLDDDVSATTVSDLGTLFNVTWKATELPGATIVIEGMIPCGPQDPSRVPGKAVAIKQHNEKEKVKVRAEYLTPHKTNYWVPKGAGTKLILMNGPISLLKMYMVMWMRIC